MTVMLNYLIVLCLAIILNGCIYAYTVIMISFRNPNYSQEDIGYEISDLQNKYGYPFEKHTVTTEDGYILELHRIPHGKISTNTTNRPVILLVHGLLGSSAQWLVGGIDKNLPHFLADRGYDVWLPNARGNTYSRKHVNINPDKNKQAFFNFSWNEIGYYDWPAVIDYVIDVTKEKQIFYAGHSQGSVTFYVMMSERPEYNDKIRLMVSLAPVVYTTGIKSIFFQVPAFFQNTFEFQPITWSSSYGDRNKYVRTFLKQTKEVKSKINKTTFYISHYEEYFLNRTSFDQLPGDYHTVMEQIFGSIAWAMESLNLIELLPLTKYQARIVDRICSDNSIFQGLCVTILGVSSGFNHDNLNRTLLPVIFSNSPAGSSLKQLLHYTQILNSDTFQKYDYGEAKNIEKYGQKTPPLYNLNNVKAPVVIYYGNNDWVTTERNILKLAAELPNVVHLKKVDDENFTHFDFVFSIHAADILYPDIVEQMSLY